jgi:hypothetical protein
MTMKEGLRKQSLLMATALVSVLLLQTPCSKAAVKFRYVTSIYSDGKGIALKNPEGVACGDTSFLFVADTENSRLLRYILKDGAIETGTVEIKVEQLSYPIKTQINSKGEIYTLDRRQQNIVRFTAEGKFIGYLRPTGLPSPASYIPRSFYIDDNDEVYVLDVLSERVLVLDYEGRYLRQIKFPQEYGFFSDVTVDFKGTVLLLDGVSGVVFSAVGKSPEFSPLTESLKEYVRFPASLDTDSRGRLYLVDRNGGSIMILGQDGSFLSRQSGQGWKEGRLNYPAQICINNLGQIFVADTRNSRIQIFELVE